jgi:hypothetical protein
MAVTNLGRTHQSSVSVRLEGTPPVPVQNYTQTWLIKIDDPCTEEGYIGTAPGLPAVGQREDVGGLTWICESRDFAESTSAPGLYTVTVQWTTDASNFKSSSSNQGNENSGGSGGGGAGEPPGGEVEPITDAPLEDEGGEDDGEKPPWLKAARWSTQTSWFRGRPAYAYYHGFTGGINDGDNTALYSTGQQRMFVEVLNRVGNDPDGYPAYHPFMSSNGEPIKNFEADAANITYTCKKAVTSKLLARVTQPSALGSCNWRPINMPIFGILYGTCYIKYAGLSVEESYYEDQQYFDISLQFDTNIKPGGWRTGFYDEGDFYWQGDTEEGWNGVLTYRKVKLGEDGQPARVALNGFGGELPDNQNPVVNWFSFAKPYNMGQHLQNLRHVG